MASQLQVGKPGLLRQLGLVSATALVISNMIGTAIFTSTGYMAGDLGDPRLILVLWIVGALFALAGALSYSELGVNFPSSGGEYVYLTRAYGPTWGFMTGWVSFFAGFSAPIATSALAFTYYLGYFFPALQQSASHTIGSGFFSLTLGGAQVVASLLVLGFTILNCFGVGRVAKVQNVLTGTKVVVISSFIFFGFLAGKGSWEHFSMPAVRTSTTSLAAQSIVSLLWLMFAYSGWNAATYVAEELRRPERTLPAALAIGTALVTALYLGLNLIFIYSTPLEQMKGVAAVGSVAASNLFGPGAAGLFSALMAISIMSTVNAEVTIGPRVYYAMAKNKAFFKVAENVHPRWHTPVVAILCQGACAMLMTLTSFPQLVIYIGFSLTCFTTLSVASLFVFRRRAGWQRLRPVSFCYPLIPAAYLLLGTAMMVYGVIWQPKASLAALATIGAGAAVYHFRVRPANS
jgi:basic amino acid/polyamine antiporter, APA family